MSESSSELRSNNTYPYESFFNLPVEFLELANQTRDKCVENYDLFSSLVRKIDLPKLRMIFRLQDFEREVLLKRGNPSNYNKFNDIEKSYFMPWREDQQEVLREFVSFINTDSYRVMTVQAIFGAGKTTLLKAMVHFLLLNKWEKEDGRIYSFEPNQIVLTAYNVSIEDSLRKDLHMYLKTNIVPNRRRHDQNMNYRQTSGISIRTYDSIIYEIHRKKNTKLSHTKHFFKDKREFVYENILDDLAPISKSMPKLILVDEAQDLDRETLEVLLEIYPESKIIIMGDTFQSITKEPFDSLLWRCLTETDEETEEITLKKKKKNILNPRLNVKNKIFRMYITPRVPCKILDEIKDSFLKQYDDKESIYTINKWTSTNSIQTETGIIWEKFRSFREKIEQLKEKFLDPHSHMNEGNTMILSFSSDVTSGNNFGDIGRIRTILDEKEIKYNSNYKEQENDKLFLTTMNSCKGLERDYVIVFLLQNMDEQFLSMTRNIVINIINVAFSRAKKKLYVVHGRKPNEIPISLVYYNEFRIKNTNLSDENLKDYDCDIARVLLRSYFLDSLQDLFPRKFYNRIYYCFEDINTWESFDIETPTMYRVRPNKLENEVINKNIFTRNLQMELEKVIYFEGDDDDEEQEESILPNSNQTMVSDNPEDSEDIYQEFVKELKPQRLQLKNLTFSKTFNQTSFDERWEIAKLQESTSIIKNKKTNLLSLFPSSRNLKHLHNLLKDYLYHPRHGWLTELSQIIHQDRIPKFFLQKYFSNLLIKDVVSILYYCNSTYNLIIIESNQTMDSELLKNKMKLKAIICLLCFFEKNENFTLSNNNIDVRFINLYQNKWYKFTLHPQEVNTNQNSILLNPETRNLQNISHHYQKIRMFAKDIRTRLLFTNLKNYFSKQYDNSIQNELNVRNLYYFDGVWKYNEDNIIVWENLLVITFLGINNFNYEIIRGNSKIKNFLNAFFRYSQRKDFYESFIEIEQFFLSLSETLKTNKKHSSKPFNAIVSLCKSYNLEPNIKDIIQNLLDDTSFYTDFKTELRNMNRGLLNGLDEYINNFNLHPKKENLKNPSFKKIIVSDTIPKYIFNEYDMNLRVCQNSVSEYLTYIGCHNFIRNPFEFVYLNPIETKVNHIEEIIYSEYGRKEGNKIINVDSERMNEWNSNFNIYRMSEKEKETDKKKEFDKGLALYFHEKNNYIDRTLIQLAWLKKKLYKFICM